MLSPLHSPSKEVDVDFLVFVQRYATDLLKWDILTLFAYNPDFCAPIAQIAQQLGRSAHSIQPDVGDLTMLGILKQVRTSNDQILYQLTEDAYLRRMILKFAEQSTLQLSS